jgi:hypothetical protein
LEQNNYDNPFLGGLKSELDEGFELDVIFNTLIAVADNIRNRYIKFEISGEQAATLFKKLRVRDTNNNQWTIGPSSGSWYIKVNNNTIWSQSTPPIGIEVENPDSYSFDQLVSHEEIKENKSSNNAGVRIDDYTMDTEIDRTADKNWLLEEWDLLEKELVTLEEKARVINDSKKSSKADTIDISLNPSNEESLTDENNDTSGLPEEPTITLDENFNIDDFFVKPEGREDLSDNNYEATNADIEDQTTTYSAPPTDEVNDK